MAAAIVSIVGGSPTTAPGDTLITDLRTAANYSVNGSLASGSITSANLKTLSYTGFDNQSLDLVVSNTNDSGPGSLRQAILDANRPGLDTINFNIPARACIRSRRSPPCPISLMR